MTICRDLVVAFMFLTRLPIRSSKPWKDDDLGGSVVVFPIVGAVIGALGAFAYALAIVVGLPPFLAATVTLAVLIAITGALHEDGLADIADGFGGGRTRDDKLRIMRDSRLGSYGTLALGLSSLLRVAAITALASPSIVFAALVATNALSRAMMPMAMAFMDQARRDGLAANAGRPHPGRATAAFAVAILLALACLTWHHALIVIAITCLGSGFLLFLTQRQIGGITGDVLGALQQTAEIASLLAIVATMGRAT